MSLEAMCPNCAGRGCEECHQTGKRTVRFATGPMFTRVCPACAKTNGAYIPLPGMHIPREGELVDEPGCMRCVWCKAEGVFWSLVGMSGDPS